MYVRHLSLLRFRSYLHLELDLSANVHVFQGGNAQGKTNLLEAIYYMATTRSPLALSDRQLINWEVAGEPIPNARLSVTFFRKGREHTLEAVLALEAREERQVFRRRLWLDGIPRRAMDVVGQLVVVLFLPDDVLLVAGSPSLRRRYLDVALCQLDAQYCQQLSRYQRVVTQRNALLRQIREGHSRPAELGYWNARLVEYGAYVLARRLWLVAALNRRATQLQHILTEGSESLQLTYTPTWIDREIASLTDATEQDLAEILAQRLQVLFPREIARAITLVGPHRDDLRFFINRIDATVYGSRGQQRTAALALKLAEAKVMEQELGEPPTLLLDDVVSELDRRRAQLLLKAVMDAEQVLITTTDLQTFPKGFLEQVVLWHVEGGQVSPMALQANES